MLAGAVVAALGLSAWSAETPGQTRVSAPEAPPVVVELFTAQGCGACPEANVAVEALAGEPGVIALTYPVDYWDYLGWADTLARPEFTRRQQDYRQALHLRDVYTPQVVVDGEHQISGADAEALRRMVQTAAEASQAAPPVTFRDSDRVGVGAGRAPTGGAEVLAVSYRPGAVATRVRQGENQGQTVRQANVVSRVVSLGSWTGRASAFELPSDQAAGEAVVVLVQARRDRRILAAAVREP